MKDALSIWLLADGKPGHENQSLGLVEALGRLRELSVHRIEIAQVGNFWSRWKWARAQAAALPMAELIIAAGHATHFALWCLRRASGAKAVVLMKPSLPMSFYDLCIAPRHDFGEGVHSREGLILSEGALNRVVPGLGPREGKLILLGGPSKTHGWDGDAMMKALTDLVSTGHWQLTDSRRTPQGFVERIHKELPQIEIYPHQQTEPAWLPGILQQVDECWVSEDSVSMTFEALSSGAKVGLLPVPRLREDARVLRGLNGLIREGRLTPLESWRENGRELAAARPLREAQRCAELLLKHLGL
ncbi:MAG: mitochondrial fission ELM1 family protein [Luteolibacter sp.]